MNSTGDWDFSNTNWDLDTVIYVSSPSSWHKTVTLGYTRGLIKTSVVPINKVKEGRFVTWIYFTVSSSLEFLIYFRYQDTNSHYRIWIYEEASPSGRRWRVERIDAGVITTLREAYVPFPENQTWNKLRVTWWNDYVGLVIRVEKWNGTAWEKLFDDTYDTANEWADVGGRVGFMGFSTNSVSCGNIDDTEIYGIE